MYARVQRFCQLGSPRPLMVANLIYIPFFQPFRPFLHSKFVKSVHMHGKQKNSSQMQYGYKKRRIWCCFQIRWKSCKKTRAKKLLMEKWQKYDVFLLLQYYWVQKCLAYNFFGVNFCTFSNGFELSIKFCVFWHPYRIFFA